MTIRALGHTESLFASLTSSGAMLVVNAVVVKGRLNADLAPQIHQLLLARHPFLSFCLQGDGQHWRWQNCSAPLELKVDYLESQAFQPGLAELMEQQSNQPLLVGGPLWRVRLLVGAEQSALIISLHHCICDGLSASALLAEWLSYHQQLLQKVAIQPKRLALRPSVHQALNHQMPPQGGSPFCAPLSSKQAKAWLVQSEVSLKSRNKLQLISFEAAQTSALLKLARAHQLSLTILLYAVAIETALALAKIPTDSVSAGGNANLRPIIEPAVDEQELACYVSMFSFNVACFDDDDFWQRAKRIHHLYQQQVATGLHLISCNDDWWRQQASRTEQDMQLVAGRFNCIHLSNLGNIEHLFAASREQGLEAQQYYFTAAQHLMGSIFWLGTQTLAEGLTVTVNCVEPIVSQSMRREFAEQFKARLLSLLQGQD